MRFANLSPVSDFPRPGIDPKNASAWLTEEEYRIVQAYECPDLRISYSIGVCLAEEQGKVRPAPSHKQRAKHPERFQRASQLLGTVGDYSPARIAVRCLALLIEHRRREAGYIEAGEEADGELHE